ncbi:hypothetical protein [Pseudoalteromonas luteoviolacea]|uniref:hypothetical protein n=1 Tax=Pseudoalteromonas luteoviolacea TaxID=43657 RepID=UPI001B35B6E5|nr:hypothetical protein [Pseudoalteromonas luteoviolacea]MBQ4838846.1 hypothetical protein [Pseudoalteromonas luteoviolacea]
MSIYKGDIKFKRSQRMDNTDNGGGRITGNVILDGEQNGIFEDISDLDRAYGSVDLMKVYAHIDTPSVEKYFGANFGLIVPPSDPSVSVTLMSTRDHYDVRSDARNVVESYLAQSSEWPGSLLGVQLLGQRAIRIVQREDIRDPEVGEVLVLTEGLNQQYVRVVDSTSEVRSFSVMLSGSLHEFTRKVVMCEISEPLRYKFTGGDPSPTDFNDTPCVINETIVANAAKYYSTSELNQDATLGSMTVNVNSIFAQLVPSSRTETPIVDVNAIGQINTIVSGTNHVTFNTNLLLTSLHFGSAVTPSSVKIVVGNATVTDNNSEMVIGDLVVGFIDYQNGIAQFNNSLPDFGTQQKTVTYTPASVNQVSTFSDAYEITAQNRGYTYVKSLEPIPNPSTLQVSYLAQGKWYTLKDNGSGILVSSNAGVGQVDFATGTAQLTLAVQPDVGSSIIYQWGTEVASIDRSGAVAKPWFKHTLTSGKNIIKDSVSVTWDTFSINETSGDGVLEVDHSTGEIKFLPSVIPDSASYTINYSEAGDLSTSEFNPVISGANYKIEVPGGVEPKTLSFNLTANTKNIRVRVSSQTYKEFETTSTVIVKDDGIGNLVNNSGVHIGTVNYMSGVVLLNREFQSVVSYSHIYRNRVHRTSSQLVDVTLPVLTTLSVTSGVGSAGGAQSVLFAPSHLELEIEKSLQERFIVGSLVFEFAGKRYVERLGSLYELTYSNTGVLGAPLGTVESINGVVKINSWNSQASNCQVISLTTTIDHTHLDGNVIFRTPGAPIAPQSLTVQVLDNTGTLQTATANASGLIVHSYISGRIDSQTGVITLTFAEATDVKTLRYSCVTYNHLPLDADIIGLDPVRLPSDGRVPVFTKGDTVLVHQTERKTFQATAGQTLNVGQVRLADLKVLELVDADYTRDLDAGTVTLGASVADGTYTVEHRFEDMTLAIDVAITGDIRLGKQLSHSYTAGVAKVSSLLIANDMWSRYDNLYDQQTWTNEWSDTLIGDPSNVEFNDVDYPITLTNAGAVTERWAIVFTSNINFKLIGEHVGLIAVGNVNEDFSPINPNTNTPYLTIPKLGWGQGWVNGNVLRLNTHGAIFPIWLIRTVLQNDAVVIDDAFTLTARGNTNKEQ